MEWVLESNGTKINKSTTKIIVSEERADKNWDKIQGSVIIERSKRI